MTRSIILLICLTFSPTLSSFSQGKVYLVLGSDTAIWEGMDVARYHCTYRLDLYVDPARNAARVMDASFREQLRDSDGKPMRLTWWMMAGNIFRYATNTNVPLPNTMTMYLMQKYHGEAIARWGDELSLHYHTFAWTDYDGDGIYYWNQSLTFEECRDDFDVTLAQFLLEEDIFPVSFRSGWHYMDDGWQGYLDELLPYSMHNDWPAKRLDTTEPLDNTYDWSRAPSTWVPFRPSPHDYQVPGDGKGWNVRSKHIGSIRQTEVDSMFARAQRGIDQVACLWGHLPETDFLDNLRRVDSIAHRSAARYSGVTFHYETAIGAMQRWLGTTDTRPPALTLQEIPEGEGIAFLIQTDEPIFQRQPFVAVKDLYERYYVAACVSTGENTWRTAEAFPRSRIAKVGAAVTDTVGNLTTRFINFLPDEMFVDNEQEGYSELRGSWSTISSTTWGRTSRIATLQEGDSVKVRWSANVPQTGRYNILTQVPPVSNAAGSLLFRIYADGQVVDTLFSPQPLTPNRWTYIATCSLAAGAENFVELAVRGSGQAGKVVGVDVVKISPFVRERELVPERAFLNFGEVSREDSVSLELVIQNRGIEPLTVLGVSSAAGLLSSPTPFPLVIDPMGNAAIRAVFWSDRIGGAIDTFFVMSNDPVRPVVSLPASADVQNYFQIVDNEDSLYYSEDGDWRTSVAQAYGPSSRYLLLSGTVGKSATFWTIIKRSGTYEVLQIVPKTVNSANRALYVISVAGVPVDSVVIDQNVGSGAWVLVSRLPLTAGTNVSVKVVNTGASTAGDVLRADAIKFAYVSGVNSVNRDATVGVPLAYELQQNYPNPFNATTVLRFALPIRSTVRITVLNLLGQEVAEVFNGELEAGYHVKEWRASAASGVYFYRMQAAGAAEASRRFDEVKKMVLLR